MGRFSRETRRTFRRSECDRFTWQASDSPSPVRRHVFDASHKRNTFSPLQMRCVVSGTRSRRPARAVRRAPTAPSSAGPRTRRRRPVTRVPLRRPSSSSSRASTAMSSSSSSSKRTAGPAGTNSTTNRSPTSTAAARRPSWPFTFDLPARAPPLRSFSQGVRRRKRVCRPKRLVNRCTVRIQIVSIGVSSRVYISLAVPHIANVVPFK